MVSPNTRICRKRLLTRELVARIQDSWEHGAHGPIGFQRQLLNILQGERRLRPRGQVPQITAEDVAGAIVLLQ